MARSSGLMILVSGMIAGDPHQGGATWAVLQYLLGLRRLGHEVCFVEPVADRSVRPAGSPLADSVNAAYFRRVAAEFGLQESGHGSEPGNKSGTGEGRKSLASADRGCQHGPRTPGRQAMTIVAAPRPEPTS